MWFSYNAKDKDGETMTKDLALHLFITNHLDNSTSDYECLAQIQDNHLITYLEEDQSSKVSLNIENHSLLLTRQNESKTQVHFQLDKNSEFFIETEEGRIQGSVITSVLELNLNHIHIEYQLILEGEVITHQTIHYYLKELMA